MKRILTLALAVIMLVGCFPVMASAATQADGKPLGMSSIGSGGYVSMTSSQELVDTIKVMEGFISTAVWDYQQYTVGYGTKADYKGQVVTPAQAEVMLKQALTSFEKAVNNYCKKIGKQPSQNQFDALVSFTYNLGSSWMSGSRLDTWLKNPTTEMELVNAMGQWVRAGGEILYPLVQRRIREAIMFNKGEYSIPYNPTPASNYNIQSNLRVISNGALPYYSSVIYQYDYATSSHAKGAGNAVSYYPIGGTYSDLLIPGRTGYSFAGWKITKINGNKTSIGGMVTASTVVEKNVELTAQWVPGSTGSSGDTSSGSSSSGSTSSGSTSSGSSSSGSTSSGNTSSNGVPFVDVDKDDWFYDSVVYVYEEDLMNGISEYRFEPNGKMTRGMLVTVLYRIDGSPNVTDAQRRAFTDISGKYYTDAVAWAKANGIVNGITETQFCPDQNVTREQAAAIFYRYCVNYRNLDSNASANLDGFADKNSLRAYSVEAMQWAVGVGLINGYSNNGKMYLDPASSLTRCQGAAILMRCNEEIL